MAHILVAMFLFSCAALPPLAHAGDKATTTAQPALVRFKADPHLPRLLEKIVSSELRVKNGCVYVAGEGGGGHEALAVFPHQYELLVRHGNAVGIRDGSSGRSLDFGAVSDFGGGDINVVDEQLLETPIPQACAGPIMMIYLE